MLSSNNTVFIIIDFLKTKDHIHIHFLPTLLFIVLRSLSLCDWFLINPGISLRNLLSCRVACFLKATDTSIDAIFSFMRRNVDES